MTDDSFGKIQSLHEEIRNSKEYKVIREIMENETSFRLFLRNYRELKRLLDKLEDLSVAIKQDVNRMVIEEITFLLHNYVASVMSLVAHTRRLHREIIYKKNPKRLKEIKKETNKRFVNNETHQIIQGLRDYSLHRKLPIVGRAMSFNALDNKPKLEARFFISTEPLLDWDKWKPLAKQKLNKLNSMTNIQMMLEHQKKDISINQLITAHHKEVVSFYEWLGNKQKEWHKEDEQKLREKENIVEQLEKPR